MPAIRGPSAAEPLWSWGEKRWTAVSVCLAALSQSCVCINDCMCGYAGMWTSVWCGCMFFYHLFLLWSSTLISLPLNFTTWTSKYLQIFLPWVYCVFVGFRYPPSSRQTSHEDGKEWLRSHSTGGLQDTGSQSPLSPPGASCTTTGKYHYSNLRKSIRINCNCSTAGIDNWVIVVNRPKNI